MKLNELKLRIGFPLVPGGKHTYNLSQKASVEFAPGNPSATLPKDEDLGNWEFYDGAGFEQTISGKFKDSVKKAVKSHMSAKGSSFSHMIKVRKIR